MSPFATRASRPSRTDPPDLGRRARRLRAAIAGVTGKGEPTTADGIARAGFDAGALAYHASRGTGPTGNPVVVLVGGTGAGKSTLANLLVGAQVSRTSFRRTFTAGVVAAAARAQDLPAGWGEWPAAPAAAGEAVRGDAAAVTLVTSDSPVTRRIVLADLPDLDGDVPGHHATADRALRWASGVVFVTTPEKYQMPETRSAVRVALRYKVPSFFVMNKAEGTPAADDWASQLTELLRDEPEVFVVPRDDTGEHPPPGRGLEDLAGRLAGFDEATPADGWIEGLAARAGDVAGRAIDAVWSPLADARRRAEEAGRRLGTLVRADASAAGGGGGAGVGVDVHPLTRHLQRRLQQQSVLYLMGPGRMIERLRSAPRLVARLPRTLWDLVAGTSTRVGVEDGPAAQEAPAPDFGRDLEEAFLVARSRAGDVLEDCGFPGDAWKMDPSRARAVAEEELADLRRWLEQRWDAKPRDTRTIERLLRHVPGGKTVSAHAAKASEAAPYLLAAACATTNALVGPVDVLVLGGYSLVTWMGEKLSNEVAAKTRETNRRIERRFAELCDEQVNAAVRFAAGGVASAEALDELRASAEAVAAWGGTGDEGSRA